MYKAVIENPIHSNENSKKIRISDMGFSEEIGNPDQSSFNFVLKAHSESLINIRDEDQIEGICAEFAGSLMADICNQEKLIINVEDVGIIM